jgi:hypothetical protein
MKRVLLVLLVAIFAIPTFQSCKKGDNDPSISLRSRKARLVGEWKLSAGSIVVNNASNIYNYTYNGSTVVESGTANSSTSHTEAISIKKDGTFTATVLDDGDQTVIVGDWYFLGANKDASIKNKEVVDFVYKTWTSTPAGGTPSVVTLSGFVRDDPNNGYGFTWQLDELKNKEIVVKYNSSTTFSSTNTYTGTMTYVQ